MHVHLHNDPELPSDDEALHLAGTVTNLDVPKAAGFISPYSARQPKAGRSAMDIDSMAGGGSAKRTPRISLPRFIFTVSWMDATYRLKDISSRASMPRSTTCLAAYSCASLPSKIPLEHFLLSKEISSKRRKEIGC